MHTRVLRTRIRRPPYDEPRVVRFRAVLEDLPERHRVVSGRSELGGSSRTWANDRKTLAPRKRPILALPPFIIPCGFLSFGTVLEFV